MCSQQADQGWGLLLTEGSVNYGLWSLKKLKLSSRALAAFNRGTLRFDLNFGPPQWRELTRHTTESNSCCTSVIETRSLINSSVTVQYCRVKLSNHVGSLWRSYIKIQECSKLGRNVDKANSHPRVACRPPGRVAVVFRVVWYQAPGWHDLPANSAPPNPVLDDYAVWQRQ